MHYQLLSYSMWEKSFVYQNTFIYFFDYSMLSQQTRDIFLHFATALICNKANHNCFYQCDFTVFQNCCYFFILVFKSIDSQVFRFKDNL